MLKELNIFDSTFNALKNLSDNVKVEKTKCVNFIKEFGKRTRSNTIIMCHHDKTNQTQPLHFQLHDLPLLCLQELLQFIE